MATNDKLKMLLDTIARLSKLIQKENELLLQPGNKEDLKQLLEEKKALTAQYEIHMQGFEIDTVKKDADPSMLKRLNETIEGFQTLTEENCKIVVQVDGRKRGILEMPINSNEKIVIKKSKEIDNLEKHLENSTIIKESASQSNIG